MGKMGFDEPKFKSNKYGNIPVTAEVDGQIIHFKSKLEYRWAQHLDYLKDAHEIKDWFYEFHTFYFRDRIRAPHEYTPDFLVRKNNNGFEYYETKGKLDKFDLDKLQAVFDERPEVKITAVFAQKPKLSAFNRTRLERYCYRIIYDGNNLIKQVPNVDMG